MTNLDRTIIDRALELLNDLLEAEKQGRFAIVVCGGASLISTGMVSRTTHDVDVLAQLDDTHQLISPAPLPAELLSQAKRVAATLGLADDWLNNGPSCDEGGLFQMGLPEGLVNRLTEKCYGSNLTVYFVSRIDQIFFKLYAAADQGPGRHVADLLALNPTRTELRSAADWARGHDPSEGFGNILKTMLNALGFDDVVE